MTAVDVFYDPDSYTAAEGGGAVTVTVKLHVAPGREVIVPITHPNAGTATTGDYSGVPTSVTFAAAETEKTFTITAVDDTDDDDDETVILGFENLPPSVTAPDTPTRPDTATVTITDNDDAPVTAVDVFYDPDSYTAAEGGGAVTVTVKLHVAPGREVIVPITHPNAGTATTGDYSGVPTSVTFAAAETEKTFTITAVDDTDDDDDETVILGFENLPPSVTAPDTNTRPADATVTITDNDDAPVTAVDVFYDPDSYTAAEGGGAVTVTVKLHVAPGREVIVPITHPNAGTATTGDYSGVPTSVTFAAAETEKTFTITATDDTDDDDDETVILGFENLPPSVTAPDTNTRPADATVTITDNDDAPITPATATVAEGNTQVITVTLSATFGTDKVIPLSIGGTATAGATNDYTGVPTNVTVAANTTTATFTITTRADGVADNGETITISLGTPPSGVTNGTPNTATVTITDDDVTAVEVFYDPDSYTAAEGGGAVTVTVKLDQAPGREVIVPLTHPNDGTATTGDYSGVPTSVTFAATETEKTFTITAVDDTVDDDNETVILGLENLPPSVTGPDTPTRPDTATVTITDNDNPPAPPRRRPPPTVTVPTVTVSYGAPTYTVPEGGTISVTMVLSDAPGREVLIPLTETPGGGTTRDDYYGAPTRLTFSPTQTSWIFTFTAIDDTDDDDGETVTFGFGTLPPGVAVGTYPTAIVTITDNDTSVVDDPPAVIVTPTILTFPEGSGGTYTVVLTSRPTGPVTVTPTVVGDRDVTVDKPSLTFTVHNWDIPQTVRVRGAEDDDTTNDWATIEHEVSGANYESVPARDVDVTVIDDSRVRPPADGPTG